MPLHSAINRGQKQLFQLRIWTLNPGTFMDKFVLTFLSLRFAFDLERAGEKSTHHSSIHLTYPTRYAHRWIDRYIDPDFIELRSVFWKPVIA
jgi:hypothetical protein